MLVRTFIRVSSLLLCAIAILLAPSGCMGSTVGSGGLSVAAVKPGMATARVRAPATEEPASAAFGPSDQEAPRQPSIDRKMVYSASLELVVNQIEKAVADTETIAGEFGGYVAQVRTNQITIRVPAKDYQTAMERIASLGTVTNRTVDALDVTDDYVDLEARLRNAQAVRARLEALLEKAENSTAAVEIERELARVGEQLEQLQGKLELLRNRVAFSTITATFKRVAPLPNLPKEKELPFYWLRQLQPSLLWGETY